MGFQGSASVNPARAGMIPRRRPSACRSRRKPRASGDDPEERAEKAKLAE